MNQKQNLLEQFDHLDAIEPSVQWNAELWEKIHHSKATEGNSSHYKLVLLATLFVLAANTFVISRKWTLSHEVESNNRMKSIAVEFLINTNSSKY